VKMSLAEIFFSASRLGVSFALASDGRVEVFPSERVTPDFLAVVRENRLEILAWLEARAARQHVVRQVLENEFTDSDAKMLEQVAGELQKLPRTFARDSALVHLMEGVQP
jgi:hypothetical protein